MKRITLIALVVLLVVLTACGGRGYQEAHNWDPIEEILTGIKVAVMKTFGIPGKVRPYCDVQKVSNCIDR